MKRLLLLGATTVLLWTTTAMAQPLGAIPPSSPRMPGFSTPSATPLTKFNLDFPGGKPSELISAIEKATGKPLNVVIRDDLASTQIPALKMNNVNVVQLFNALESASVRTESYAYATGVYGSGQLAYGSKSTSYGFRTDGTPTDDSIWCFFANKAPEPPSEAEIKTCRFYSLEPMLERGFTVDDITTAIQTGWKMMGYGDNKPGNEVPKISFHKETRLLIVVGDPTKLSTIEAVLTALNNSYYAKNQNPKPAVTQQPAKSDK